ncbi:hypothetical protein B0T24DRAFT_711923 [Lasiosphaeria ovina]|uniref:Uncharacterized protein n=1 Tax=Lasiosphaeria ovina TaxID=92902 RepID=A0AAE0MYY9_9PEZI|nr:hypothetical protein B0T24DRAFT_711923 [Lasiosphaeria ovina]
MYCLEPSFQYINSRRRPGADSWAAKLQRRGCIEFADNNSSVPSITAKGVPGENISEVSTYPYIVSSAEELANTWSKLNSSFFARQPRKVTKELEKENVLLLGRLLRSLSQILCPITAEDTPQHLQQRFEEEVTAREARRKEREEQHLYLGIKAITEATFQQQGGTDLISFDANPEKDPAAPRFYRQLRNPTMQELVDTIGEDRYWTGSETYTALDHGKPAEQDDPS